MQIRFNPLTQWVLLLRSKTESEKRSHSAVIPVASPRRSQLGIQYYRFILRILGSLGLHHLILGEPISVDLANTHEASGSVANFKLLHPAETIDFGDPAQDAFLRNCQEIEDGRTERADIFVCEVPSAKFSPEHGLVCDSQWRSIIESVFDHRRFHSLKKTLRPRKWETRTGVFSSVQHAWHFNSWHWTADSLPQVLSLAIYMRGRPLTLLMSSAVTPVHRESLECILPENFTVEYVDLHKWYEVETFILPSYVSSRANAFLPPGYYDYIRSTTFVRLGIAKPAAATGRYYISRARARHRRVNNEAEMENLLSQFGFEKIFIEDHTFREQVELFRGAEAIVSPHGAALGGIVYGEGLKVCVLYPEARPAGYFYTLARGLGHQHFCTNANAHEHSDFTVDLKELRRVLTDEMRLG